MRACNPVVTNSCACSCGRNSASPLSLCAPNSDRMPVYVLRPKNIRTAAGAHIHGEE